MAETAKKLGKRFVHAPENPPPVITTKDWVQQYTSQSPGTFVKDYLLSLFPIYKWLPNYNVGWLYGDLIAGITVGMVLVPQSMSYAKVATLPPQYGLYSSFVGVFVYCFFATSKDVSIGPVAVMSLETATIIAHVQKEYGTHFSAPEIATTLAFICGFIVLGIGLLRLGWIVEFIPLPAVAGFMTGSAVTIASQQLPGLFGLQNLFNTRAAAYIEIIDTLKNLGKTTKDAWFGLTCLFFLYFVRWLFEFLSRRYPSRARTFFYISVMRNAIALIFLTIAAYLVTRHEKPNKAGNYSISILKTVPRGFQNVGQPRIEKKLLSSIGSHFFVATLVLVLEHISISKSFGRLNGYKINPNQELIAIGVTNTVGTCFNAYPATGSFSRTALKSKCGVRTPAAGWFTGIVVIVALYGLTDAFFYIPNAALSAVIIHAVADIVTPPRQVYNFWRVNPLEFIIWLASLVVTIFTSIENGIYVSAGASVVLLLLRVARPGGHWLGRVKVHAPNSDEGREIFLPIDRDGALHNPHVAIETPIPGVYVYRLEESLTYPNASLINRTIVDFAREHTRRGKDITLTRLIDRPWNEPGPRRGQNFDPAAHDTSKPLLRAFVLDFAAVGNIDTTGVQSLIDTRNELERWADAPVEFHFANILSPWVRRGLVAGGFGTGDSTNPVEIAPVLPTEDYADSRFAGDWKLDTTSPSLKKRANTGATDIESNTNSNDDNDTYKRKENNEGGGAETTNEGPLLSALTPFFHVDLESAVSAAEKNALRKNDEHSN